MKLGKTLNDLALELERQMNLKKDFLAPTGQLKFLAEHSKGAVLEVGRKGFFAVTDVCHDQIGQRLGIPAKYYDRMKAEAPMLLERNVNHWLHRHDEKRMIRTLDGKARAFLSDRYRPLDNYDLAEAILPSLSDLDCRIESCELTEKRLYIKAVCPKIEGEVTVGDVVQAGIVISNSEIGCGSLSVEPLAFRLVCKNGAISLNRMRKYHVGKRSGEDFDSAEEFFSDETRAADDKAFWLKVKDLASATVTKEGFEKILSGYRRAKQMPIIGDPVKVVEEVAQRKALSENEKGGIIRHLISGGDLSLYGLMNAVTRFSQDVIDYDRATDLERIGGEVVELQNQEWELINKN